MSKIEDKFTYFLPIDIVKAEGKDPKDTKRWIQGIASTPDKDMQNEKVVQDGIDYNYFLKHGFFNEDHKQGPEYKVGEPTEVRKTKNGLYVKGFLYDDHPRADEWWKLMKSLESSNSSRKVGFSIEGKVIRKEGNTITKCWVKDIAITASPINTNTYADILKSLSNESWDLESTTDNLENNDSALVEGEIKDVNYFKSLENLDYKDTVHYLTIIKNYSPLKACILADAIFKSKNLKI